jgi:hypothetical protein
MKFVIALLFSVACTKMPLVERLSPMLAEAGDTSWNAGIQYASEIPISRLWFVPVTIDDEVMGVCLFVELSDKRIASLKPAPIRDPGFSQKDCDKAYKEWSKGRS